MRKGVALIPQRAVTELQGHFPGGCGDKDQPDNVVAIRPVNVGEQMSNMWIIESGLQSGESIIVEGLQKGGADTVVTRCPCQPPREAGKVMNRLPRLESK